jgi:hypothetical protein
MKIFHGLDERLSFACSPPLRDSHPELNAMRLEAPQRPDVQQTRNENTSCPNMKNYRSPALFHSVNLESDM